MTIDARYAGRLRPGEVKLLYPWRCFMGPGGVGGLKHGWILHSLGGCTVACEESGICILYDDYVSQNVTLQEKMGIQRIIKGM